MAKRPNHPLGASMDRLLRLPIGSMGADCKIQLIGDREVLVEGSKGVLEYDDTLIRLNLGNRQLKLMGRGLSIRLLERNHAEIEGVIISLEFVG